ncbi:cyclic nucleotide-binding domain-containing protein [Hyalangium rubrum]|uniref:Cyclic nucleotide-binding domain-containing protein n=1 Tax=Hyalangium rubrum TaxID=3103134 RepID=A0ABU5HIS5_9BACT|nr:cyclic nucleotide-binding domain-containing protein [Hyalangium sp. s54d21]MDY7231985.1 cyclic nucleotide-binding domain-containing protein [Hyalangium sp. s54d21]
MDALREHKNKAAEFFAKGALESALSEYQKVVQEAPEDLSSRQKVAELLQRLGRKKESIATYEALAEAWARQGWLLRAIALCKVILQIEPRHNRTQRLLAELHAKRLESSPRLAPAPKPVENAPATGNISGGTLPRIPIFSQLSGEELLSVMERLELRVFQPKETIIQEGQLGGSMFAIVEGSVEVVRKLETGGERTLAFMGEGDLFGEMALLSAGPRLASVRASERTMVLELPRERVEQLVTRHPSVGQVLQTFHRERLLINMLRSNPLFRALTPLQREALARDFQLCSVPAGKPLTMQGQSASALYLLLRGTCRVLHEHEDGRESDYRPLREGDVFGEISLMLGVTATATVTTAERCTLLRLDREACERHILHQPGLREALSRMSQERLQRTVEMTSGFWLDEGDLRI